MRRLVLCSVLVGLSVSLVPCADEVCAADDYTHGPDSVPHAGAPKGKVTQFRWKTSKVYEGTERDCWVYVPAQYDGKTPACLMVFQDGGGYVSEKGAVPRAGRVRQPHPRERDAGDRRRLHQPGPLPHAR